MDKKKVKKRWKFNRSESNEADRLTDNQFRYNYGISLREFDELVLEQGGACAICGNEKKLVVDHCHTTGKIRGLLCRQCNAGVGLLGDSFESVQRAASYLRLTNVYQGTTINMTSHVGQ